MRGELCEVGAEDVSAAESEGRKGRGRGRGGVGRVRGSGGQWDLEGEREEES